MRRGPRPDTSLLPTEDARAESPVDAPHPAAGSAPVSPAGWGGPSTARPGPNPPGRPASARTRGPAPAPRPAPSRSASRKPAQTPRAQAGSVTAPRAPAGSGAQAPTAQRREEQPRVHPNTRDRPARRRRGTTEPDSAEPLLSGAGTRPGEGQRGLPPRWPRSDSGFASTGLRDARTRTPVCPDLLATREAGAWGTRQSQAPSPQS